MNIKWGICAMGAATKNNRDEREAKNATLECTTRENFGVNHKWVVIRKCEFFFGRRSKGLTKEIQPVFGHVQVGPHLALQSLGTLPDFAFAIAVDGNSLLEFSDAFLVQLHSHLFLP